MTNDEVKSRMQEAYNAGMQRMRSHLGFINLIGGKYISDFDKWLLENYPEVTNAEAPDVNKEEIDNEHRAPMETFWADIIKK